jgi:hypothetical protein
MIANLQISTWVGHRLDKAATRAITEQSNADQDAARVNKHIIPKPVLQPIQSAATGVRLHFYANTLPWKDNGDRLLTRQSYVKFIERHSELKEVFNGVVEDFLTRGYLGARDQASFRMGDLFDPNDYPSPDELRRRFAVHLDIDAVTEADDFRVALDKNEIQQVHRSMEEAMQGRLTRAMRDVWDRLADTLGHFASKMGSDEVFRDSTVKNLEALVETLPDLNIIGDPNLDAILDDIKGTLIGFDAKSLRKDAEVRSSAATEAQRIMDDMKGFMAAFGANT